MKHTSLTGRRGEELAFNYYRNKGIKVVKWVNEGSETGLPFDIEVGDDENLKECIEVKTTDSKTKDWFEISVREWQVAVEKGESFSIARVVLSGDKRARVAVFKAMRGTIGKGDRGPILPIGKVAPFNR
ncbi:putative restriction endonuclease type II [Helianthus annuus]|nr:putative restriction endonuclease type II [Helianthus annuus]